ncbi:MULTISPECIES: hypothetical protein [Aneurinibacillus]|jgi:hypothetical protein|uniref:Uncharacterized protein n=1 Tax=Aneurinibacillus thermoaerophilus TaxID=143495 RepID=A0ABX8Y8T2_ANETH|nr:MULTISPECIES: hypothetical protein [Aneurinibacillus]AMA72472.1 hypothetical protein ACH33_06140 [Aneurinibacillus sp. XH2]MED0675646.1 hypothetical protein [Aneurinibacillus thermoaerophilus]MED0679950.1 hypothetical protein [Aneurinibacillus thermoaerophilus]MED0735547.1 hypothetical protein [Aneurinibacillus thermoaerophilus]MED0763651.1 hypothetical protein [Aneurinibacillus thermoaerophilus]
MLKSFGNSRGSAFFIVLVYTQILCLIVLHHLSVFSTLRQIPRNDEERMKMHYATEAGLYLRIEEALQNLQDFSQREYQIGDVTVKVLMEPWGTKELWLLAVGSAPFAYAHRTRLWCTVDKKTGIMTKWSEYKIDDSDYPDWVYGNRENDSWPGYRQAAWLEASRC